MAAAGPVRASRGGAPPTREQVEAAPRSRLSRGSALKPAVWKVEAPGGEWIVKDTAGLAALWRPVGRWLLRRELRVLRRLEGVAGVPRIVAVQDRDAFAQTFLAGRPLNRVAFQGMAREFADGLFKLLAEVHARGVYHLDVRQRQNVLLTDEGTVNLVDFGAALAPWPGLRALAGPLLAWIDRQSVLKHLARYAPEALSAAEARSVLRAQRVRRAWLVSRHKNRGEDRAARRRLAGEEPPRPPDDRPGDGDS